MTQREILETYLKNELNSPPTETRSNGKHRTVFRHKGRTIAFVETRARTGSNSKITVFETLTVRCDRALQGSLRLMDGFSQGTSEDWITVCLDDTVSTELLCTLIQMAVSVVESGSGLLPDESARQWLIPANPKYFDLIQAFRDQDTILWKQSSKICTGDIIFMYVAAPYSAILFRCIAVEVDIPYTRKNSRRNITKAMRIRLLHSYPADAFSLEVLKNYGVVTVRGPRHVPANLSRALLMACSKDTKQ